MPAVRRPFTTGLAALSFIFQAVPALAANPQSPGADVTFADLADLADSAPMVIEAQVTRMTRLGADRAAGLAPGIGRFYVEADTRALLVGKSPIGESLRYLVDMPLDSRGKGEDLKDRMVILFARAVPGRPGEVQLIEPDSQLLFTPALDAKLRGLLRETVAPDAPGEITGVRELLYVPGTLAGQGETQIFLNTRDGSAASITVRHEPGKPVAWGASFSELVADVTQPPAPETLEWYRLACALPQYPPQGANISQGYDAKRQAQDDYRAVLRQLGPCTRNRS
ncbi:hypothetical protein FMM79_16385 [Novosphingobium sp. BW1]|nr:hypothetical protein FMM79_16385 [Novosphingobium sp. BW1]